MFLTNAFGKLFPFWILLLVLALPQFVSAAEKIVGDYHVTLYQDVQGSAEALEAFTKQSDNRVFFGVSCSLQSPLPMLQLIAFDDEVMSETPKLLQVEFTVDDEPLASKLNGILSVVDNADEFSNKVRFEIMAQLGSSFSLLQQAYMDLLSQLREGKELKIFLSHRTLGEKKFEFSLQGLDRLMQGNEYLCR